MVEVHAGALCQFHALRGEGGGAAARLVDGVLAWRQDLQAKLGDRLPEPLNWREDPEGPTVAGDCGEAGLLALRLLAVYAERTDLELPEQVPPIAELDRAFREAHDQGFQRSHFGQLLACDAWLPVSFAFTVRAPLPDGSEVEIGSGPLLVDQLRRLNGRTFQADESAWQAWRSLPAAPGGDLLDAARRGLATLLPTAQWASERGLPVAVRSG